MLFWIRFVSCVGVVASCIALDGCSSADQVQSDEEKEPHFVLGKARVNSMDYQGGVEAFEQSLEANPHSAMAHFELGCLFDEKVPDPAAAIYHYDQYLKLRPHAENTEVIRQRIESCKQQLAADVLPLPSTPAAQKQINQLIAQNQQLQDEVNKWHAWYASQTAGKSLSSPAPDSGTPPAATTPASTWPAANASPPAGRQGSRAAGHSTVPGPASRTHKVAAGETAARIARQYGVPLNALLAANPGLEPRRMRVGQIINIPPP